MVGWKARPLLRIRYGWEDDADFTAEGADIRLPGRPGKLPTNAVSVKLRGSHAPLRRTTRSATCLAPVTDEAKEWGEVWVEDSTSLVLDLGRGAGHKYNFARQSPHLRNRCKSTE